MADKNRVCCMLTPEDHHKFKIACAILGITMDWAIREAVAETIVIASLQPETGAHQEVSGNG